MNTNIDRKYLAARVRGIFGVFVLASTMGSAHSQNLTKPATPAIITPPDGQSLFLVAPAVGTQGYICLPTSTGAATVARTVPTREATKTRSQTTMPPTKVSRISLNAAFLALPECFMPHHSRTFRQLVKAQSAPWKHRIRIHFATVSDSIRWSQPRNR